MAVSARTVLLRPACARGNASTESFATARDRWHAETDPSYLVCSDGVYTVDFARRTIRTFFTPAAGETVTFGRPCDDHLDREWKRVFVSTDKSFHVLTEDGAPVLSVPRVQDRQKDRYIVRLGGLENPERYFAWYQLTVADWSLAEPAEFKSTPFHFHEYDTSGRELAHRSGLRRSLPSGFVRQCVVRSGYADDGGRGPCRRIALPALGGAPEGKHPEARASRITLRTAGITSPVPPRLK